MFGVYNEKLGDVKDLSTYQLIPMVVLALLILYFGWNPDPVFEMMLTNANQISSLMAVVGV
jgi:NADH-quinone oxidoreductase subunit M